MLPKPVVKVIEEAAPEEPLELSIHAESQLNPDVNGRPSPLVLRVYQLRKELQFRSSDFFVLYDNDLKELSSDLLAREEYVLNPGQVLELELGLSRDTRFVAFLAAFSDLDNAVAKFVSEIDADDPEPLHLIVTERKLSLLDEDAYELYQEQQEAVGQQDPADQQDL